MNGPVEVVGWVYLVGAVMWAFVCLLNWVLGYSVARQQQAFDRRFDTILGQQHMADARRALVAVPRAAVWPVVAVTALVRAVATTMREGREDEA